MIRKGQGAGGYNIHEVNKIKGKGAGEDNKIKKGQGILKRIQQMGVIMKGRITKEGMTGDLG